MATSSPAYAVHLLEAARAWTDAQYFRLLSRELPVDSSSSKPSRRPSVEGLDLRCGVLPSTPKFSPAAAPQVFADAALKAAHAEFGACRDSRGNSPASFPSSSSSSPGGWSSPDAPKKTSASNHHNHHQQQQQQQMQQQQLHAVLQIGEEDSSEYVGGQTASDLPPQNLTSRWRAFWRQIRDEERAAAASSSSSSSSSSGAADVCYTKTEEDPSCMTAEDRVLFKASDSVETTASSVSAKTAVSSGVEGVDDPPASPARQKRLYTSSVGVDSEAEKLRRLPKVTGVRFQAQRNRFVAEWYDQGKTRMAYFPVKQHGFEGARRLAIECRERVLLSKNQRLSCGSRTHGATRKASEPMVQETAAGSPKLLQNPQPLEEIRSLLKRHCPERVFEAEEGSQGVRDESQAPSPSSPLMNSKRVSELMRGETGSSLQERLFLAQAALNVVLIDLLSKCLPCGSGKEAKEARKLVEQLHRDRIFLLLLLVVVAAPEGFNKASLIAEKDDCYCKHTSSLLLLHAAADSWWWWYYGASVASQLHAQQQPVRVVM
ncbi:hypothetical protein Emed_007008 [Eimeria media]